MGDYARKSVNLQIALLKEVNPWVQLPKVRNLKIVLENNLPWIASQEIVVPKETNSTSVPEGMKHFSVSLPKACKLKIVLLNNLPWIASQDTERSDTPPLCFRTIVRKQISCENVCWKSTLSAVFFIVIKVATVVFK